jgi:O-antigen ligase
MRTGVPQQSASLKDSHVEAAIFDSPIAFNSLIFLTFIMFVAPQAYFTGLIPLRLALVSALLSMAAYAAATMSQRHLLTVWGPEVKLIVWLVVFAVISIPSSRWRGGSYEILFDTYMKAVIVFFLIANLLTSERRFHTLLWALTWYSAFNAVSGINAFRQGIFIPHTERIYGASTPLTMNPNDLALTLNLLIPFIGYLFLSSKSGLQRIVAGAILLASVVCVIVTYSRGGAITLLAILLWYVWTRSGPRRIGALIGVSLLIGVIILVGPAGYSDRIVSSTDFSMDKTGSADARWTMMKEGVRQTYEHPLGVGLGMMALLNVEEGRGWMGVHNVYLEISTELGLIPGILFIVLLWKLIAGMRRIRSLPTALGGKLGLLAGATECSLVAFAVGAMFHPMAYNFYFYILAGIAVALKEMAGRLPQVAAKAEESPTPVYRAGNINPRLASVR